MSNFVPSFGAIGEEKELLWREEIRVVEKVARRLLRVLVGWRTYARGWLRYFSDVSEFMKRGGKITHFHPMVRDYFDNAGNASGHYFHQDLHVAQKIFAARPKRHIDVGSRVDGFCAHVASFRQIDVLDVRDLPNESSNISFIKHDLMSGPGPKADSVSCLHTIEHFGLGRYGDPINPEGHLKGFSHLVEMVERGGTLYISFPIASRKSVKFNAHRVFEVEDIFSWPRCADLELVDFSWVDDKGVLHPSAKISAVRSLSLNWSLGIYTFQKMV